MARDTRSHFDPLNPPESEDEAEKAKADGRRRQRDEEDIKWLMGHPAGRRIAARILEFTGTRRTVFNPSGSVMALNEGKRTVGLWLEDQLISASHEGYLKLLKEYASE